jgi:hypothetical protein
MLNSVKEKSWSVLLIKGHVLNDQVRAERCENCKSTSKVLTTNFSNPNLLLYGCKDSKCRHRLLRSDFNDEITPKLSNSSVDKKKRGLKRTTRRLRGEHLKAKPMKH